MDWKALEAGVRTQVDRGEHDSAATLVIERMGPDLHEFFQRSVDDDEAGDALSIWREAVWKDLRNFRWECSLRGWAYRLGRHSLNRILRRPHRHREHTLPSSAASRLAASIGASGAMTSERHQALAQLRATLEPEDQELLTLRVDRELEWEEVSVVLDSTSVAVRKRFERLTRRLEQMARERGLID